MQLNIPTWLTLFRVVLIPFFVLAFYLPFSWAPMVCAVIFVFAAVTDWFDGFWRTPLETNDALRGVFGSGCGQSDGGGGAGAGGGALPQLVDHAAGGHHDRP